MNEVLPGQISLFGAKIPTSEFPDGIVRKMKKDVERKITTYGNIDVNKLSSEEQYTFFMTLLTRILNLYAEKKQNE